jgi:hypothetical protein
MTREGLVSERQKHVTAKSTYAKREGARQRLFALIDAAKGQRFKLFLFNDQRPGLWNYRSTLLGC